MSTIQPVQFFPQCQYRVHGRFGASSHVGGDGFVVLGGLDHQGVVVLQSGQYVLQQTPFIRVRRIFLKCWPDHKSLGQFAESVEEYEQVAREFEDSHPRIAELVRKAADNARAADEVLERAE